MYRYVPVPIHMYTHRWLHKCAHVSAATATKSHQLAIRQAIPYNACNKPYSVSRTHRLISVNGLNMNRRLFI